MLSCSYKYREIAWEEILHLIHDINEETQYQAALGQIRAFRNRPSFSDLFGPKFSEFESTFKKQDGKIRKYTIHITRSSLDKTISHIDLTVRIKENADQTDPSYNYPSIEIIQYEGNQNDFNIVKTIIEKKLSLKYSERQFKADLLARYKAAIQHEELRTRTESLMSSHQYDQAISGAAILVESTLRDACVNAGCAIASTSTGIDLAKHAYHATNGCLQPPYPVATQANHGVFLLFQGFFLYIRNAYIHNSLVTGDDRQYVIEYLTLCEFLLRIIQGSTKR